MLSLQYYYHYYYYSRIVAYPTEAQSHCIPKENLDYSACVRACVRQPQNRWGSTLLRFSQHPAPLLAAPSRRSLRRHTPPLGETLARQIPCHVRYSPICLCIMWTVLTPPISCHECDPGHVTCTGGRSSYSAALGYVRSVLFTTRVYFKGSLLFMEYVQVLGWNNLLLTWIQKFGV